MTPDGRHIFVSTNQPLSGDNDGSTRCPFSPGGVENPCLDIFAFRVTPATGYPRPAGAALFRVPLVPAFAQCTAPNRTHGPALAFPSCAPPSPGSSALTVGVGDGDPALARSIGYARWKVLPGTPGGVDDADVRMRLDLTNVMRTSDLSEYTGELKAEVDVRLTDADSSAPLDHPPQTVSDFPFAFTVPCAATADPGYAATCALATSAEALLPGSVQEGTRAIWGLGQLRVLDGGADEDADTAPNAPFARQGVFIP